MSIARCHDMLLMYCNTDLLTSTTNEVSPHVDVLYNDKQALCMAEPVPASDNGPCSHAPTTIIPLTQHHSEVLLHSSQVECALYYAAVPGRHYAM